MSGDKGSNYSFSDRSSESSEKESDKLTDETKGIFYDCLSILQKKMLAVLPLHSFRELGRR